MRPNFERLISFHKFCNMRQAQIVVSSIFYDWISPFNFQNKLKNLPIKLRITSLNIYYQKHSCCIFKHIKINKNLHFLFLKSIKTLKSHRPYFLPGPILFFCKLKAENWLKTDTEILIFIDTHISTVLFTQKYIQNYKYPTDKKTLEFTF